MLYYWLESCYFALNLWVYGSCYSIPEELDLAGRHVCGRDRLFFIRQFAVYGAAQADDERFGRHIDTVADFRSAGAYLL